MAPEIETENIDLFLTPREQNLSTLIGNEKIISAIRNMVDGNRLPHALLFHGPDGIGKLSTAFALMRKIECENGGEIEDCSCRFCQKISRESWFDLHQLKPETTGQKMIKVDKVREVEDKVYLTPFEGKKRFLIIEEADRMNPESANAFLKTLEEPPASLQIILTTNHLNLLLPTIRSRCTEMRFNPLTVDLVLNWLNQKLGDDESHHVIALLSKGLPGLALKLLDSELVLKNRQAFSALAEFNRTGYRCLTKTASELNQACNEDFSEILGLMLVFYRSLLINEYDVESASGSNILMESGQQIDSGRFTNEAIVNTMNLITEAYDWSGRMLNSQLALENLLLKIGSSLRK